VRRLTPALIALPVLLAVLPAQAAAASAPDTFVAAEAPARQVWKGSGKDAPLQPGPSVVRPRADRPTTSTFVVRYNGFTTQQKAAFQLAVDAWSKIVVSSVPIVIDASMESLDPGVLGSAGPAGAYRRTDASQNSSYYVPALANALAGRDLATTQPDIAASFSNDPGTFFFGTDGQVPSGRYDFATVVLHEIAHGLGFLGDLEVVRGLGTYDDGGAPPTPFSFDRFVGERRPEGTRPVIGLPRPSAALGNALQGGALYWTGASGRNGAGGNAPKLYAPSPWEDGSSSTHLDETTYPTGTANALMTPWVDAREVLRDPGPIAFGILKDIGWGLSQAADPDVSPPLPPQISASASKFQPLRPRRVLDTRTGLGGHGTVGQGGTLDLFVTDLADVPQAVTAVVLNLTAVGATRSTDVRAYPGGSGAAMPGVSSLNVSAGQTRANLVTVAVGPGGAVRLRNSAGSVHLVADLAGYYAPAASAGFFAVDPKRVLDTRTGGGSVGPLQTRDVRVAGVGAVPASATAVVVSLTAVGASRATDVRAYAAGPGAAPGVSNLNLVPGGPVPNLAIVPVGEAGAIRLRNASGQVHLVVDVFGYFSAGAGGQLFRPLFPTRILDTRPLRLGEMAPADLITADRGGVPATATAVVLNVTGIGASKATDVRVYPRSQADQDPPTVSTLNLAVGQTAADAAYVRTGAGSAVRLLNKSGEVGLAVDVAGWFGPA